MQRSQNFLEKTHRFVFGGILVFLILLATMLTGCATPSGCNINAEQVVILTVPEPKQTNGEMATDLRNMIDERQKDNTRKEGLRKQIEACSS